MRTLHKNTSYTTSVLFPSTCFGQFVCFYSRSAEMFDSLRSFGGALAAPNAHVSTPRANTSSVTRKIINSRKSFDPLFFSGSQFPSLHFCQFGDLKSLTRLFKGFSLHISVKRRLFLRESKVKLCSSSAWNTSELLWPLSFGATVQIQGYFAFVGPLTNHSRENEAFQTDGEKRGYSMP